ncbi:unnamed protein product, partial [Pelagomonas calceolata]
PYFSPSDTLRAGFLAARGVLSRWYSSLPVRDSASCAASRVFLAAISASMPASVARSWSRYDFSATISWTRLSRRCARNALTAFGTPASRRLFTVSFFLAKSLLTRETTSCAPSTVSTESDRPVRKSTSVSGASDNSSRSHFSAMARPT